MKTRFNSSLTFLGLTLSTLTFAQAPIVDMPPLNYESDSASLLQDEPAEKMPVVVNPDLEVVHRAPEDFSGMEKLASKIQAPQAAPMQKTTLRVIPLIGKSVRQTSFDSVESERDFSLALEGQIHPIFSVGLEVGTSKTSLKEIRKGHQWYWTGIGNIYGSVPTLSVRDMEEETQSLAVYGKATFLNESSLRPFVGLGLGYERSKLNYTEASPYQGMNPYDGYHSGYGSAHNNQINEVAGVSQNQVTGTVKAGLEYHFNNVVGLHLEGEWKHSLKRMNDDDKQRNLFPSGTLIAYDQKLLQQIADDLQSADQLAVKLGVMLSF